MSRLFIAGGYGVFGAQIARELGDLPLTIAGRDEAKASRYAAALGKNARGVRLDVRDPGACRRAFEGHAAVVHAAGPFQGQGTAVLEACLEAGCHYVDIADDREYVRRVRSFDGRFRTAGLAAAAGCSSLPGISEALASLLRERSPVPPALARVTLFIGNRNAKGEAAVRSVFQILGKSIEAPQGRLPGFGDPETVALPPPWGPRTVFNFESPEYDLFPERFGARAVSVKLGFEWGAVGLGFRLLGRLSPSWRTGLLKPLVAAGNALSFFGSSGGAVSVEFHFDDGTVTAEAISTPRDGQTMAVLPCVLAARRLIAGGPVSPGAHTASQLLGARELISALRSRLSSD
jgi:hypothetical protein